MKKTKKHRKQGFLRKTLTGAVAGILALSMAAGIVGPAAQSIAAEKAADLNTTTKYTESLGHNVSTEFAGRIWTDKSVWDSESVTMEAYPLNGAQNNITVENDSDFLVAFSALATSQSVTGHATAPVDVVFVFDMSSSMVNNRMGNQTRLYHAVNALNTAMEDILATNENARVGVVFYNTTAVTILPLDHYEKISGYNYFFRATSTTGNTVDIKAKGSSNTYNLTRNTSSGTNIQRGLFEGMEMLATEDDKTVIIDGKEVTRTPSVILISDGEPSVSSESETWWNVPNDNNNATNTNWDFVSGMRAIMTGSYMKDEIDRNYYGSAANGKTTVYSIGIGITGIEARNGRQNLAYMTIDPAGNIDKNGNNDVMSKKVRAFWEDYSDGKNAVLEDEQTNRDYTFRHPSENDIESILYVDDYYDADDADSISNVFQDVVASISISAAEVPTEHDPMNPLTSGYITYTDPIGEYMEVKDMKSILYGGHEFTVKTKEELSGNVTKYTFTELAEGNAVYNQQSLENIIIKVETATDTNGIKSQVLTIEIPAALIPIRVNTVELNPDGTVKTHTNNNAYPIRVFYTVGLQDAVKSGDVIALDMISEEYLAENTNEDGTVNFYSNLYSGNPCPYEEGATIGDATAVFDAAPTNPFYYMQEDVLVYADAACTIPAQKVENSSTSTYYYKEIYYYGNEVRTTAVVRTGAQLQANTALIQKEDGYWYRPAGTVRTNRMLEFAGEKGDNNATNTASDFYTPTYDSSIGHFKVYLGNNGLLKMKATGSLEITKEVTADAGLTAPQKDFEFTVSLTDGEGNALTGTYNFTVSDAEGEVRTGTIANGGTLTLKDGETAKIINLPPEANYTVTETEADGFTTKADGKDGNKVSGSITAGETAENTFTNHYEVESLTFPAEGGLSGKKVLKGRDWDADMDEYSFELVPYNNAPLPDSGNTIVTVKGEAANNEMPFDFGTFTFTEPGRFVYTIHEKEPAADDTLPGMSYSRALYRVIVLVEDNGDGSLRATADVQKLYTDDAVELFYEDAGNIVLNPGEEAQDEIVFTNKYKADSVTRVPVALKDYTDNSGKNPLKPEMFHFKLTPLGVVKNNELQQGTEDSVPMPTDEDGNRLSYVVTGIEGIEVTFPAIVFASEHIPAGEDSITFRYQMEEVIPEGAVVNADGKPVLNGMTYDPTKHIADVTVSVSADSHEIKVTVADTDGLRIPTFVNEYNEKPVTLGEEGNAPINGTKVFTGRANDQWLENDSFTFKLAPMTTDRTGVIAEGTNLSTKGAADAGYVVITEEEVTVTADDAEAGAAAFDFDKITFTKQGTFRFEVSEVTGKAGGVTYDTHVCTVTVTVTDTNMDGQLEAAVTYSDGNKAEFNNTYKAEFDADTAMSLTGTKTLEGRELTAGTFFFEVKGSDNSSDLVTANANGQITFLENVTYTEAGVYTYLIKEQIPAEAANSRLDGVTYDSSVYKVTVTVTDDNEGNLKAAITGMEKSLDGRTFTAYDGESPVFVNTYKTTSAEIELYDITKVLEGVRKNGEEVIPLQAGEFEFKISILSPDTDNDPTKEAGLEIDKLTVTNDANGNVDFGKLTFTKPGTYVVRAEEQIPADAADNGDGTYTKDGITYSTNAIQTTFRVRDNGLGQLVVTRIGTTGSREFKNIYKTEGELEGAANLNITKNFIGREWGKNDSFTFVLAGHDEVTRTAIENGTIVLPATDEDTLNIVEASGSVTTALENIAAITVKHSEIDSITGEGKNISTLADLAFGNVKFTEEGTYQFHIREVAGELAGVDYDGEPRVLTVKAADDGKGKLTVSVVSISGGSDDLTFTNIYNPDDVILYGHGNLHVNKVLEGREWTSEDEFNFKITADTNDSATADALAAGNIVMEAPTEITVNSGNKDYIHFGNIIFKQAGSFKFLVEEIVPADEDKAGGMAYDTTKKTVVVKVTYDKEAGIYSAAIDENSDDLTFTNKYDTEDAVLEGAANLQVTKKLEGRSWKEGDAFKFTLTPVDSDETGIIENEVNLSTKAAVDAQYVTLPATELTLTGSKGAFGNITFTKPGIYTFEIAEVIPTEAVNNQLNGVTYDTHKEIVVVTVTDNGEGALVTEVTGTDKDYTFTNTYKASSAEAVIQGLKKMEGRQFIETDAFEFMIREHSSSPANTPLPENTRVHVTGEAGAESWKVVFGEITYTEAGTYHYVVSEMATNIKGVSIDETQWDVYVDVTDDGDGNLVANVRKMGESTTDSFEFVNKYKAGAATLPDEYRPKVNKSFTGRKDNQWLAEDKFTFVLAPAEDDQTGVTAEDGTNLSTKAAVEAQCVTLPETELILTSSEGAFGSITFKKAGTYTFCITEKNEGKGGITYDSHTMTVVVHVTDNKEGNLVVAAPTVTDNTFTNTYTAGTATAVLSGKKVLNGRELKANEFAFTVKALTEGAPMPAETEVKNAEDKTVTFAPITFTEAGEYRYEISEKNEALPGVTYDSAKFEAIVTVTDNNEGTLTAAVAYKKDAADVEGGFVFNNSYSATSVGVALEGTKTVVDESGAYILKAGDFKFEITPAEGNPASDPYAAANTVVDAKTGKFTFAPKGQFTEAGTYVYTIKEVSTGIAGIVYDDSVYQVTITIKDVNAQLTPEVKIQKDGADYNGTITFENKYVADAASAIISGKKVLEGRDLAGNDFEFKLEAANELALKVLPQAKTVKNDQAGVFQFESLNFKEVGTYLFKVTETEGTLGGVTYDKSEYIVEVVVTGEEPLTEAAPSTEGEEAAPSTEGEETVPPTEGEGTVPPTEGEETVPPTEGEEAAPSTEGEETVPPTEGEETAPSTEGEETVPPTEGEEAAPSTEGEETVSPTETEDTAPAAETELEIVNTEARLNPLRFLMIGTNAVTAEETPTEGTVVTAAKLYAKVTIKKNDTVVTAIEFKNTYKPEEVKIGKDTAIPVKGTKTLTGRALNAGEFQFEIIPEDANAPMPSASKVTNDANGNFEFGQITFKKEGVYYYSIIESSNGIAGIEYDKASYTMKVVITDDGKGKLHAAVNYYDNAGKETSIAFSNQYTAAATTFSLTVVKELKGRELKDGEFEFEITAVTAGAPMPAVTKVKNAANGTAAFGEIKFTKTGDYTYKIREIKGSAEGVTYDNTVYEVTVHVTDDLKGQLKASLDESFKGIKFVNKYEKPEEPKKDEPKKDEPKKEEPKQETPTPAPKPTPALSPATGDLNNPILWIAAAVAAAGGMIVSKRKKR